MIRVLLFLFVLALFGLGLAWLVDRPGEIVLTWQGYRIDTSVAVGLAVVLLAGVAIALLWTILRFAFRLPSLMSLASRARKRAKGYAALSRGMIAAGAGDAATARRGAVEARRHLPDEPLALLLTAQAAQLDGDRAAAEAAFVEMSERPDTKLLGLRGLHIEAQRRGDTEAAHQFAQEAHRAAPLPWSAKAVLSERAEQADWEGALEVLKSNIAARLVDKPTGERQRAVLETAIALGKAEASPDDALRLVTAALKRTPDLVPAVALAARLLRRRGDLRRAAKLIETAWPRAPHPDLADVYIDLRAGDSNTDRLGRARTLARLAPDDPESRMAVARAAIAARNFKRAREAMAPLIAEERPTARMCLIMAELEQAEFGASGAVREWLSRGSHAPRDPVWIADGVAAAEWAPASPVTGQLDAYIWQRPPEAMRADIEALAAVSAVAPQIPQIKADLMPVEDSAAELPHAVTPEPVVFPLAAAPDDPGPRPAEPHVPAPELP